MNETIGKNKCIVIIKNGINSSDKWTSINSENKLIVDINGKEEEFQNINKKQLNELIDEYINKKNIIGTQIISFEELLKLGKDSNNAYYQIRSALKFRQLLNLIDNFKFSKHILTILGIGSIYFFYQLGYSFLYGYYFGGYKEDTISIIDMIVNPVPFNFKSISAIGIIFLFALTAYLVPLILSIYEHEVGKKAIYFGIHIFMIFLIIILSSGFFWGNYNNIFSKSIDLILLLFIIPATILWLASIFKFIAVYPLKSFSVFLYLIIFFSVIINLINIDEKQQVYEIICIVVIPIINIIISFSKSIFSKVKILSNKINKSVIRFFTYLPIVFFGVVIIYKALIIKVLIIEHKTIITLGCTIIITLMLVVLTSIGTVKNNKKDIKSRKKIRNNDNKKKIKIIPILLTWIMSVLCLFSFIPYFTVLGGMEVRKAVSYDSKDLIVYNNLSEKSKTQFMFGSVVAQTDQVYFISKYPERKLVTIKTRDIITNPCEEFVVENFPEKFLDLKDNILKKYDTFLKDKNVEVQETNNKSEKNFEYRLNIKANKEFVFSIKYSIGENDKVDSFYISAAENNKDISSTSNDTNIRKLINELEFSTISFYNIPVLKNDKEIYYFSGGKLQLLCVNNDDAYVEMYMYKKEN